MIKVCINGQWQEFEASTSGEILLAQLGLQEMPLVAELNGEALAKPTFMARQLADGDLLELVSVVGGG